MCQCGLWLLTSVKEFILVLDEVFDTDVYDEGHQASEDSYYTTQYPTHRLHSNVGLQVSGRSKKGRGERRGEERAEGEGEKGRKGEG